MSCPSPSPSPAGGGSGGAALARSAARVNADLARRMRGRAAPVLYEAAAHLVASGGKRLRPHMAIKSCELLGGAAAAAMPAAAAVEMIHNFTLVHDDIMDNDEVRHGVPTVHRRFGVPVAILAGDVLFSKAFEAVSAGGAAARRRGRGAAGMPAQLAALLAAACTEVCEGQMLDIEMAAGSRMPSEPEYLEMVSKKTAALFDASCAMGAVCAGAGRRDVSRLALFGRNLGIAFQITDDLIGVMGDPAVTKKPVGNDLREGKKSLPILMAAEASTGAARRSIARCLGNRRASRRDLAAAVQAIRSMGIDGDVRDRAMSHAEKARRALSGRRGPAAEDLLALLDFVVERSL